MNNTWRTGMLFVLFYIFFVVRCAAFAEVPVPPAVLEVNDLVFFHPQSRYQLVDGQFAVVDPGTARIEKAWTTGEPMVFIEGERTNLLYAQQNLRSWSVGNFDVKPTGTIAGLPAYTLTHMGTSQWDDIHTLIKLDTPITIGTRLLASLVVRTGIHPDGSPNGTIRLGFQNVSAHPTLLNLVASFDLTTKHVKSVNGTTPLYITDLGDNTFLLQVIYDINQDYGNITTFNFSIAPTSVQAGDTIVCAAPTLEVLDGANAQHYPERFSPLPVKFSEAPSASQPDNGAAWRLTAQQKALFAKPKGTMVFTWIPEYRNAAIAGQLGLLSADDSPKSLLSLLPDGSIASTDSNGSTAKLNLPWVEGDHLDIALSWDQMMHRFWLRGMRHGSEVVTGSQAVLSTSGFRMGDALKLFFGNETHCGHVGAVQLFDRVLTNSDFRAVRPSSQLLGDRFVMDFSTMADQEWVPAPAQPYLSTGGTGAGFAYAGQNPYIADGQLLMRSNTYLQFGWPTPDGQVEATRLGVRVKWIDGDYSDKSYHLCPQFDGWSRMIHGNVSRNGLNVSFYDSKHGGQIAFEAVYAMSNNTLVPYTGSKHFGPTLASDVWHTLEYTTYFAGGNDPAVWLQLTITRGDDKSTREFWFKASQSYLKRIDPSYTIYSYLGRSLTVQHGPVQKVWGGYVRQTPAWLTMSAPPYPAPPLPK